MKAEDFSIWLCGVARLSADQRRKALAALADVDGGGEGMEQKAASETLSNGAAGKAPRRRRPDALGTSGHERVESRGCPHCAGREVIAWGRSRGLSRFRCKGCGRTFNALTKTPMAHLRKRERWLDHAQAMIEGKSLAKTAGLCGVHSTTAFRWRHRFLGSPAVDKPRTLNGIVEADETFILESFKGKRRDLPRAPRKRGGKAAKRGLSAEQIPVIVARDRTGATIDAVLPRLDAASITAALGQVITRPAELCCDGGAAITALARRAQVKFHVLPAPGTPKPEAPDLHINNVNAYHGRLKEWMRRFHGVATKNLPTYLSWRRTIEALSTDSVPDAWIMGAAGLGPYQQNSI